MPFFLFSTTRSLQRELAFQDYVSDARINNLSLKELQTLEEKLSEAQSRVKDAISVKYRTQHDCVVCMENSRETLLMPCKHFVLCGSCASSQTSCAICRTPISKKIQVFMG